MKSFIKFGKCSTLYLYIFYSALVKTLNNLLYTISTKLSKNDNEPKFPITSNHTIVSLIFKFLSYMIFSPLFYLIFREKPQKKRNEFKPQIKLIHQNKSGISMNSYYWLIFICFSNCYKYYIFNEFI